MKEYLITEIYGTNIFEDIVTVDISIFIDEFYKSHQIFSPDFASIMDLDTGEILCAFDKFGELIHFPYSNN